MRKISYSFTIQKKIKSAENELKIDDLYIISNELVLAVYNEVSKQNPYLKSFRKASTLHSGSRRNFNAIPFDFKEEYSVHKKEPSVSPELRNLIGRMILKAKHRDNIEDLRNYV